MHSIEKILNKYYFSKNFSSRKWKWARVSEEKISGICIWRSLALGKFILLTCVSTYPTSSERFFPLFHIPYNFKGIFLFLLVIEWKIQGKIFSSTGCLSNRYHFCMLCQCIAVSLGAFWRMKNRKCQNLVTKFTIYYVSLEISSKVYCSHFFYIVFISFEHCMYLAKIC